MEHFPVHRNIRLYINRLSDESDPRKRAALLRLLIEEEDKLGIGVEQLQFVEERIAAADKLIDRQRTVLADLRLRGDHNGLGLAQQLLNLLIHTKGLLVHRCTNIQKELSQRVI